MLARLQGNLETTARSGALDPVFAPRFASMTEQRHASIVSRARAGDRAAFDELCGEAFRHRWRLAVTSLLPPALRHRVDVDDVVQEAMEGAWRDLGQLDDPSPAGFRRWVRGVLSHRVQDAIRRAGRERRDARREERARDGESRFGATDDTGPLARAAADELHHRIAAVLDELSDGYREVIRLRVLEGCSTREVAEALGKTEGNVAVTLHRALIRFREGLKREGVETTHFRRVR